MQSKGLSRVFSNIHSSKASILRCSAFFIVQISHPHMTTRKTIALTIWTFVSKVMSLPSELHGPTPNSYVMSRTLIRHPPANSLIALIQQFSKCGVCEPLDGAHTCEPLRCFQLLCRRSPEWPSGWPADSYPVTPATSPLLLLPLSRASLAPPDHHLPQCCSSFNMQFTHH